MSNTSDVYKDDIMPNTKVKPENEQEVLKKFSSKKILLFPSELSVNKAQTEKLRTTRDERNKLIFGVVDMENKLRELEFQD